MQNYLMKKIIIRFYLVYFLCALLAMLTILTMPPIRNVHAREQIPLVPEQPFIHFEHSTAVLYESHNGFMRPVTTLPQSYFAQVVAQNADFFEVIYYDLRGFVRRDAAVLVSYQPVNIFGTGRLIISGDVVAVNIRSRPDHLVAHNIVGQAPHGAELLFYGTIEGTSPDPRLGSTWYFVRFTQQNGTVAHGYIYSASVTSMPIPQNVIEWVMVYAPNEPVITPPAIDFPPYLTAIFIITLSIPAVLIMILLFKKPKSTTKTHPQKTPRSF